MQLAKSGQHSRPGSITQRGLRVDREASTPIATQIAHQLAWLIASGELGEGDPLPATRRLAEELSVNLHTVRAAYRQLEADGLVDTQRGRRTRVLRFDPSTARETVADIPTYTIGLVIPEFSPFYAPLLAGIEEAARELHSMVFVCNAHEDESLAARYIDRLVARRVDGIVLAKDLPPGARLPPRTLTRIVAVDVPGFAGPAVEFDLEESQSAVTRHLIDHGHERIGFLSPPTQYVNVRPKLDGYLHALESADLSIDPELIVEARDFTINAGVAATDRLLDSTRPPTAIAASSDNLAFGAFHAITRRGLQIPDDVALVGNDGSEMASIIRPGLTTVSLPVERAGRLAVEMLTQLAAGGDHDPDPVTLTSELVVRHSCGC